MEDAERVAASLTAWLGTVTFEDRDADQVTDLLVQSALAWGAAQGWRVYRRARSVAQLPPPYADRHSWVDVGIARQGLPPIVVEVDQSDRKRTLEKLQAEAAQGRVALWLRWGTGPFHHPPAPVCLVAYQVTARKDATGRRTFGTPAAERPAPVHSGVELGDADQGDLFAS
ncbi:hypothetical protein ACFQY4_28010 [Catellatospora bangladeshensis]|uniref:Uncharacterized protein n=1 Tax=Catellatospora bangladeshensis TaxID=310355 RepID=A0A8J3JUU5_9ACTN|nr:hypothetical protein [Catellatospora bangladeshensis]GIF85473.1 hypothetical protein Cba03nite_68220 [Catellatospora bangladeshensis]